MLAPGLRPGESWGDIFRVGVCSDIFAASFGYLNARTAVAVWWLVRSDPQQLAPQPRPSAPAPPAPRRRVGEQANTQNIGAISIPIILPLFVSVSIGVIISKPIRIPKPLAVMSLYLQNHNRVHIRPTSWPYLFPCVSAALASLCIAYLCPYLSPQAYLSRPR